MPNRVVCTCWGLMYGRWRELRRHGDGAGREHADQTGGLARLICEHGATPAPGAGCKGYGGPRGEKDAGSSYGCYSVGRHDLHSHGIGGLFPYGRRRIRPGSQAENVVGSCAEGHNSTQDRVGKGGRIGERHVLHPVRVSGRHHPYLVCGGRQRLRVPASDGDPGICLESETCNRESRATSHADSSRSDVVTVEQARVITVVWTPIAPDVGDADAKVGRLQQLCVENRRPEQRGIEGRWRVRWSGKDSRIG